MGTVVATFLLFNINNYIKIREVIVIRPQRRKNEDYVNETIPKGKLLVIDDEGNNLGQLDRDEALEMAYDKDLDLVVVSPNPKNMVAKMMDYSKYRFDQQKKLKELRKNQQVVRLKEVKLSPTIDTHDFDFKLNQAKRFLERGDKVKVSIRFFGRMITHTDLGKEVIERFISELGDDLNIETKPKMEGRVMMAIVAPQTNK